MIVDRRGNYVVFILKEKIIKIKNIYIDLYLKKKRK